MSKNGIENFTRISKTYMDNPGIRKEMLKNEVTKKILDAMETVRCFYLPTVRTLTSAR
ncbi:MAG: hypothetical protein RBR15_15750 [Sphaerochaeta sp.]|nr:hypothetical protein [Sphaerochaeta sp.]